MSAFEMRERFYTLIKHFNPAARLDDDAADLVKRYQNKLRTVCVQLGRFEQQREKNWAILADYDRAVAELETSQVVHESGSREAHEVDGAHSDRVSDVDTRSLDEFLSGTTSQPLPVASPHSRPAAEEKSDETGPPVVSGTVSESTVETSSLPGSEDLGGVPPPSVSDGVVEAPQEIALPESDGSDEEEVHARQPNVEAAATLKQRRELFCQQQQQLLQEQLHVDKLQMLLYCDLIERKANARGLPVTGLDRQLRFLEEQVALQRDQVRLHERQLEMIRDSKVDAP
jgi:hypothetical protein